MAVAKPKVSIGLPVYNGEKFLRQSLNSLLAQSFEDFEIIICDNASTDKTQEICQEYIAQDQRIKYYRNAKNLGAAPNFNLAFRLSRGQYFKWAAHDDYCSSEFIGRCVELLDLDTTAVLVWSKILIIDEYDQPIAPYSCDREIDSPENYIRFGSLLYGNPCYMVFGLIRRNAILRTKQIMGSYNHGDGVFLERLALLGRFIEIPEVLFFSRRHFGQSMDMINDRKKYSIWFDARYKNRVVFPWSRVVYERFRSINMFPMRIENRIECYKRFFWNFKGLTPIMIQEFKNGLKELIAR